MRCPYDYYIMIYTSTTISISSIQYYYIRQQQTTMVEWPVRSKSMPPRRPVQNSAFETITGPARNLLDLGGCQPPTLASVVPAPVNISSINTADTSAIRVS